MRAGEEKIFYSNPIGAGWTGLTATGVELL
jgi:hypothetical protein